MTKSNIFKDVVMTYWLRHRFFHEKSILNFVIFDDRSVDARLILDKGRSKEFLLDE